MHAGAAIAAQCDVVLGFSLGELIPWDREAGLSKEARDRPRCRRIDDVLEVYGAAEAAGVVTVPPVAFQRFCFAKVAYMKQMVACAVPIGPTLGVTRSELIAAHGGFTTASGDTRDGDQDSRGAVALSAASGDSAAQQAWKPACAALASRLAGAVMKHRRERWAELQLPMLEHQPPVTGAPGSGEQYSPEAARRARLAQLDAAQAGLRLRDGRYFLKGDAGWCRNGNTEVVIARQDTIAKQQAGQEPEPELEPESDQGAEGEEEELRRKICASLMTQLVVDMASGVQLQPCLVALQGRSEEFRGIFLRGQLVAVASTYFRRPGVASYNLTEVESEVLLVDHGVPATDVVLSAHCGSVTFGQIRAVMEAAASAIAHLIGHTPMSIRTDVAVDGERGLVVLSEIEGGLDFSVFPQQVKSHDVTDTLCGLVAADAHAAALVLAKRRI